MGGLGGMAGNFLNIRGFLTPFLADSGGEVAKRWVAGLAEGFYCLPIA